MQNDKKNGKTSNAKRTIVLTLVSLLVGTAVVGEATATLNVGVGGLDCDADPCAQTACGEGEASAHAVGSEKAWAKSAVGESSHRDENYGTANSASAGVGNSSAWAKGKKDWSLREAESECDNPETTAFLRALLASGAPALASAPVSIGCIADERIVGSTTFVGRILVSQDGRVVAVDDATGLGLELGSFENTFHGASLATLAPLDVTGLLPTPLRLALELDSTDSLRCSASYLL